MIDMVCNKLILSKKGENGRLIRLEGVLGAITTILPTAHICLPEIKHKTNLGLSRKILFYFVYCFSAAGNATSFSSSTNIE